MMLRKKSIFICCFYIFHATLLFSFNWEQELRWDWSSAERLSDTRFWNALTFPKKAEDFLWGVATSAFQIEGTQSAHGHCSNNWTMRPHLNQPGTAVDHWDHYKEDVQLRAYPKIPIILKSLKEQAI